MPTVSINDAVFKRKMNSLVSSLKPGSRLYRGYLFELAKQGTEAVVDNFKKEKDSKGNRWKPLEPKTLEARRKRTASRKGNRFGPAILRDSGLLWDINSRIGAKSVFVGTGAKYGEKHDKGIGVPKRQWLYISTEGSKRMLKATELFIKRSSLFKRK